MAGRVAVGWLKETPKLSLCFSMFELSAIDYTCFVMSIDIEKLMHNCHNMVSLCEFGYIKYGFVGSPWAALKFVGHVPPPPPPPPLLRP